jgi:hypothetical protein
MFDFPKSTILSFFPCTCGFGQGDSGERIFFEITMQRKAHTALHVSKGFLLLHSKLNSQTSNYTSYSSLDSNGRYNVQNVTWVHRDIIFVTK